MNDIYAQYRVEDPRKEINDRYPALLEDEEIFTEVIAIANSAFYYRILKGLPKAYGGGAELADEIVQNAAVRVYELWKRKFQNA